MGSEGHRLQDERSPGASGTGHVSQALPSARSAAASQLPQGPSLTQGSLADVCAGGSSHDELGVPAELLGTKPTRYYQLPGHCFCTLDGTLPASPLPPVQRGPYSTGPLRVGGGSTMVLCSTESGPTARHGDPLPSALFWYMSGFACRQFLHSYRVPSFSTWYHIWKHLATSSMEPSPSLTPLSCAHG